MQFSGEFRTDVFPTRVLREFHVTEKISSKQKEAETYRELTLKRTETSLLITPLCEFYKKKHALRMVYFM